MKQRHRRISRHRATVWLKERFFLRLHMFWILVGAFLAGLVTTKLLGDVFACAVGRTVV